MMTIHPVVIALTLVLFCTALQAQTQPSTQPTYTVGPTCMRHLVGFNFVYTICHATIKTIADVAGTEVPKLFDAVKNAGIQQQGPVVFIYKNTPTSADQPFDFQLGMAVEQGPRAPPGYQSTQLNAIDCATILYTGDMANIGHAYGALFQALPATGKIPTGETREYYLYFEDDKSPNNVVLITAVLK
jgi:effector-binding domain-containing protein